MIVDQHWLQKTPPCLVGKHKYAISLTEFESFGDESKQVIQNIVTTFYLNPSGWGLCSLVEPFPFGEYACISESHGSFEQFTLGMYKDSLMPV